MSISLFWFRRDLRLNDNKALYHALKDSTGVQPIFIFDNSILEPLSGTFDARVSFIHSTVSELKQKLNELGSDLWIFHGKPTDIFKRIFEKTNEFKSVYCNHDYEPSAIERDAQIETFLQSKNILFNTFKDHVIFEKNDILTDNHSTYTVYTPYKKKWLSSLSLNHLENFSCTPFLKKFNKTSSLTKFPSLKELNFLNSDFSNYPKKIIPLKIIQKYSSNRDLMGEDGTSHLGIHLRFGTLSIRNLILKTRSISDTYLSELIWREFFIQILFHFPRVITQSFRPIYDEIEWRSNRSEFERWCNGQTGVPIVDAGMRELNQTGFMHNRARMITASYLTKHLLIHWSEGEKYFAKKLLDFELAANNGNWQWVAGSGCDSAPYFRIFNPEIQAKKFDPENIYIKKWVPEFSGTNYPKPIISHGEGRDRALREYSKVLKNKSKENPKREII